MILVENTMPWHEADTTSLYLVTFKVDPCGEFKCKFYINSNIDIKTYNWTPEHITHDEHA